MLRRALAQGFDLWQFTYTVFHNAHGGSLAYVIEEGTPERLAALDPVPPLLVIFGTRDQLISPPSSSTKCQARALS
jgi:hypothetical protein